jgi:RNA polymerase sigma factor (sigma-70 family)
MSISPANSVVDHLRRVVLLRDSHGMPDGQLLESFIAHRDEAAFATLVTRHGPMVMGVCRRILGNHHDAEDAFQATFLVLARKAASIVPREMLGNWLYGVAYRAAAKVRAMNARRRAKEREMTEMPVPVAARQDDLWRDLRPLLDCQLNCLPDNYRVAIVLCDLEGKSGRDAARQLGWPEGTLSSRLARGRKLLAKRLTRRGLEVSGGALAMMLARADASACVPERVATTTIMAAGRITARAGVSAGTASAPATVLAEGVIKTMLLTKLRFVAGPLLAISAVTLACGALASGGLASGRTDVPGRDTSAPAADEKERPKLVAVNLPGEAIAGPADRSERDSQPKMPDGFITEPGEYKLHGGKLVIKVWEQNGRIGWNAAFPRGSGDGKTTLGPAEARIKKGSPWFLFPASAEVIWIYEPGEKRMILVKRRSPDDLVMKHADLPSEWKNVLELEPKLPEKVVERLPSDLRPAAKAKE